MSADASSAPAVDATGVAPDMAGPALLHEHNMARRGSLGSDANWDARSAKKGCGITRKQLIISSIIIGLLLAGGIAGLVTWTVLKRAKSGNRVDVPSNTNLTIVPSPDLPKSFYGITYTPLNAQYPECGGTLGDVIEDVKVLSQLTTRLRLYGMDCEQATHTLEAIKQLKVNVKIVVTIWLDENEKTYDRQYRLFLEMLDNELASRGHPKIPVYTTDIGDVFTEELIRGVDSPLANVHPFFAGITASTAADWTWKFFEDRINGPARKQGKTGIISETGWPTRGDAQDQAVPSVESLQRFLDDFVCQSNAKGLEYYFFEAFDEPWKAAKFIEREGYWGILTKDRKPKVKFPDCKTKAPSA
ncbi:glycoside hydrolase superfamily [Thamnocephalis sphaerospora]|uniref:glucan endo-1,3-beta-D-glucosidase n=1 Tax=Thamnocephalis sphaerospora TaxID=78915 RepID=A0A4V1IWJ6_9FUNG|nr:glycoside hydrolase superfamily [Thamnocephalis sphaerospora]|eukprot:RKP07789.1 glycoside hydrolase superfamily [Thamnocephalis sphaerospora]